MIHRLWFVLKHFELAYRLLQRDLNLRIENARRLALLSNLGIIKEGEDPIFQVGVAADLMDTYHFRVYPSLSTDSIRVGIPAEYLKVGLRFNPMFDGVWKLGPTFEVAVCRCLEMAIEDNLIDIDKGFNRESMVNWRKIYNENSK